MYKYKVHPGKLTYLLKIILFTYKSLNLNGQLSIVFGMFTGGLFLCTGQNPNTLGT